MTREQERRIIIAAIAQVARYQDESDGGVSRAVWTKQDRELFEAVHDLEPLPPPAPAPRRRWNGQAWVVVS